MLPPVAISNCRMVPGCKAASPCKRGRVKEEGEACSRPWLSSQAVGRHQAVRWLLTGARRQKRGGDAHVHGYPPGCRTISRAPIHKMASPREIPWPMQELQVRAGTGQSSRSMCSNSRRAGAPGEGETEEDDG